MDSTAAGRSVKFYVHLHLPEEMGYSSCYSPKPVPQRKVLIPDSARKSSEEGILRAANSMEAGERTEKV